MELTVVVPIHKITDDVKPYFENCLKAITEQKDKEFKLVFVISNDVTDKDKQFIQDHLNDIEHSFVLNDGETDYCSQLNYFVENNLETEFFTVLQYDDILLDNHVLNANRHIRSYDDIDLFIPLVFEIDPENNFMGFSNETVWAVGHMEEFGHFDLKNAKERHFYNYSLSGCIINADMYLEIGGLKSSMKKFYDYEFLLRVLGTGNKAYVIPKITYKHVNDRKDSIFQVTKNITKDEEKFWYSLARKEYHFDYDRNITYEKKDT